MAVSTADSTAFLMVVSTAVSPAASTMVPMVVPMDVSAPDSVVASTEFLMASFSVAVFLVLVVHDGCAQGLVGGGRR